MPKLPSLSTSSKTFPDASELAAKPPQRATSPPPTETIAPQKPKTPRKPSMDFPEADPWGSPALHKGHNHDSNPPKTNGSLPRAISNGVHTPGRTTSNFTTATSDPPNGSSSQNLPDEPTTPAAGVWGSYDGAATSTTSFGNPAESGIGDLGFDAPGGGGDRPTENTPSRSFGGGRVSAGGVEENIIITLLPEKEGMFLFQHHNYQVSSHRRGSKVVRRYSDFVWLLDCLHKRYPFRQLPLLPPKRVGGM